MRRSFALPLALLFLLLLSCAGPAAVIPTVLGPTITYNPFATISPTPFGPPSDTLTPSPIPSPTSTAEPTATVTPIQPAAPTKYTLQAVLDDAAHSLAVNETISYQNSTGVSLDNLVLAVEPDLWENCFQLDSLAVDAGTATSKLNGQRLEVQLAAPLAPGGTLNLTLHYKLSLPLADAQNIFGYNNDQTNLVDWYPFIVPYSHGWLLHDPSTVGEHLVYDRADFDVTLTLTNPALPILIAASAPAQDGHYRLDGARSFALSVINAFQNSAVTVGNVTVTSYYFTADQAAGERVLQEVAKALATFSDRFGPYQHTSLSIVETDFFDGMEYDGLFFLSRDFYTSDDGTVLNNLIDIAVHETAHQWWYGSVGNDQALEPWLDEGLSTYSESLFYEANYPGVQAWQAFRVDLYTPTGWVDTTVYEADSFRTYANAVYLRGALFLHELRGQIGDEAFFAFLKDYAAQMSGKIATGADFFRILRLHTDVDLSRLIGAYFKNQH